MCDLMKKMFGLSWLVEISIEFDRMRRFLQNLDQRQPCQAVGLLLAIGVFKRHFACCCNQVSKCRFESFAIAFHLLSILSGTLYQLTSLLPGPSQDHGSLGNYSVVYLLDAWKAKKDLQKIFRHALGSESGGDLFCFRQKGGFLLDFLEERDLLRAIVFVFGEIAHGGQPAKDDVSAVKQALFP